jgi:bifunctional non-homologous end joining protein LigD
MNSRFVIHQHRTGRTHFDMRIVLNGIMRSWSLLKEPPLRDGDKRLAVERESFTADSIYCRNFEEQAFGAGGVQIWDRGEVEIQVLSPKQMVAVFNGTKFCGKYELRRMRWYPGNRWMLTKLRIPGPAH